MGADAAAPIVSQTQQPFRVRMLPVASASSSSPRCSTASSSRSSTRIPASLRQMRRHRERRRVLTDIKTVSVPANDTAPIVVMWRISLSRAGATARPASPMFPPEEPGQRRVRVRQGLRLRRVHRRRERPCPGPRPSAEAQKARQRSGPGRHHEKKRTTTARRIAMPHEHPPLAFVERRRLGALSGHGRARADRPAPPAPVAPVPLVTAMPASIGLPQAALGALTRASSRCTCAPTCRPRPRGSSGNPCTWALGSTRRWRRSKA